MPSTSDFGLRGEQPTHPEQHHPFKDDYASNKRSVYLMTKRLTAKPSFQVFEGPNPNACTSDRDQSATAQQALYFVNDEFLHGQADRFVGALLEQSASDPERLECVFKMIPCRQPTRDESALMRMHLAAVRDKLKDSKDAEKQARSGWTTSC